MLGFFHSLLGWDGHIIPPTADMGLLSGVHGAVRGSAHG